MDFEYGIACYQTDASKHELEFPSFASPSDTGTCFSGSMKRRKNSSAMYYLYHIDIWKSSYLYLVIVTVWRHCSNMTQHGGRL